MGKLGACTRCVRFCEGHCTWQFVFRIFTLSILVLATILQGIAISPNTRWDTFDVKLETKAYLHHDVEISAYQTLYDVAVNKDVPDYDRSIIPSVYPIKKVEFQVEWKDEVSTYETSSQGLGIGAIMVLENALLIHFLIPESYFSKFFQPIALVLTMLMCATSGAFSILGALSYGENYQQVFYYHSGPSRIRTQVKQLVDYGFNYKFNENALGTGYKLALAAGAMFSLCGVLCIVNLVEYSIGRYKIWKKSKMVDCDEKNILPSKEMNGGGGIKERKTNIKKNKDQIVIEDVEDTDIKDKTKKTSSNMKEKDSKTDKSKKG